MGRWKGGEIGDAARLVTSSSVFEIWEFTRNETMEGGFIPVVAQCSGGIVSAA